MVSVGLYQIQSQSIDMRMAQFNKCKFCGAESEVGRVTVEGTIPVCWNCKKPLYAKIKRISNKMNLQERFNHLEMLTRHVYDLY